MSDAAEIRRTSVVANGNGAGVTLPLGGSELDEKQQTALASKTMLQRARDSFSDLSRYPRSIKCSLCARDLPVPAEVWWWKCAQQHENERTVESCSSCNAPRPANLPWPSVSCGDCSALTAVPGSEGANVVQGALTALGATIHKLTLMPATFHCSRCSVELAMPGSAWSCQTCSTSNEEKSLRCSQCAQSKDRQKLLCGLCKQSTDVPPTKLADATRNASRLVQMYSTKALHQLLGEQYVSCPCCNAAVKLPANMPQAAAAPAAGAAAGSEQKAEAWSVDMNCDNCKQHFYLQSAPQDANSRRGSESKQQEPVVVPAVVAVQAPAATTSALASTVPAPIGTAMAAAENVPSALKADASIR